MGVVKECLDEHTSDRILMLYDEETSTNLAICFDTDEGLGKFNRYMKQLRKDGYNCKFAIRIYESAWSAVITYGQYVLEEYEGKLYTRSSLDTCKKERLQVLKSNDYILQNLQELKEENSYTTAVNSIDYVIMLVEKRITDLKEKPLEMYYAELYNYNKIKFK